LVRPSLVHPQACAFRKPSKARECVLVGVLGADAFTSREVDCLAAQVYRLVLAADQVHLDPALRRVEESAMRKRFDSEIGAESPIEMREDVQIERGGHAFSVVVRGLKDRSWLLEVEADEGEAIFEAD
jgi:hypothetical protein